MTASDVRFNFMTFAFSVTLGLVISTFDTEVVSREHLVLKFGYTIPALLLMVDMWLHYNNHHVRDGNEYREWDIFLDTILLACMYAALAQLRSVPPKADVLFETYPAPTFWYWLIVFAPIKMGRTWRMSTGRAPSWYTVLHFLFLVLVLGGCYWQAHAADSPLPFWLSGFAMLGVTSFYLALVYVQRRNPLRSISRTAHASSPNAPPDETSAEEG